MTIQDMYKIATRTNQIWGIEGYQVPREYVDPLKQVEERHYIEMRKKGKCDKPKGVVTKKGSYLDDLIKNLNQKIGPWTYHHAYEYVNKADIEKGKKKPRNTNKLTYIDAIFKQKDRAPPGPGKYNVEKPQEEREKEIQAQRKLSATKNKGAKNQSLPNFLDEYEYMGAQTPGPGMYNAKLKDTFAFDLAKKIHFNKTKPDDWIQKHKKYHQQNKKSKYPDVGSYEPVLANTMTFTKLYMDNNDKTRQKPKVKFFGTQARFIDIKKSKSQLAIDALKVPGPGEYECRARWLGKDQKLNKTNKMMDYSRLSKGVAKSIYY